MPPNFTTMRQNLPKKRACAQHVEPSFFTIEEWEQKSYHFRVFKHKIQRKKCRILRELIFWACDFWPIKASIF